MNSDSDSEYLSVEEDEEIDTSGRTKKQTVHRRSRRTSRDTSPQGTFNNDKPAKYTDKQLILPAQDDPEDDSGNSSSVKKSSTNSIVRNMRLSRGTTSYEEVQDAEPRVLQGVTKASASSSGSTSTGASGLDVTVAVLHSSAPRTAQQRKSLDLNSVKQAPNKVKWSLARSSNKDYSPLDDRPPQDPSRPKLSPGVAASLDLLYSTLDLPRAPYTSLDATPWEQTPGNLPTSAESTPLASTVSATDVDTSPNLLPSQHLEAQKTTPQRSPTFKVVRHTSGDLTEAALKAAAALQEKMALHNITMYPQPKQGSTPNSKPRSVSSPAAPSARLLPAGAAKVVAPASEAAAALAGATSFGAWVQPRLQTPPSTSAPAAGHDATPPVNLVLKSDTAGAPQSHESKLSFKSAASKDSDDDDDDDDGWTDQEDERAARLAAKARTVKIRKHSVVESSIDDLRKATLFLAPPEASPRRAPSSHSRSASGSHLPAPSAHSRTHSATDVPTPGKPPLGPSHARSASTGVTAPGSIAAPSPAPPPASDARSRATSDPASSSWLHLSYKAAASSPSSAQVAPAGESVPEAAQRPAHARQLSRDTQADEMAMLRTQEPPSSTQRGEEEEALAAIDCVEVDPEWVAEACEQLLSSCREGRTDQKWLCQELMLKGRPKRVVDILKAHPQHSALAFQICAVMCEAIGQQASGTGREFQRSLHELGAHMVLQDCLATQSGDTECVLQITAALYSLVTHQQMTTKRTLEQMVSAKLPRLLVSLMGRYRSLCELQLCGCRLFSAMISGQQTLERADGGVGTLYGLVQRDEGDEAQPERVLEVASRSGAGGATITAMATHPADAQVQLAAARALWHFSLGGAAVEVLLVHAGAIPRLVAAIGDHAGHLAIQEAAVGALLSLAKAGGQASRLQVASEGGIAAMKSSLVQHEQLSYGGEFAGLRDWLLNKKGLFRQARGPRRPARRSPSPPADLVAPDAAKKKSGTKRVMRWVLKMMGIKKGQKHIKASDVIANKL